MGASPVISKLAAETAGCAGLQPTVAAIKAGKDICLANKETLIAGGPHVLPLAKKHGVHILPADSEHSVSSPSLFCVICIAGGLRLRQP